VDREKTRGEKSFAERKMPKKVKKKKKKDASRGGGEKRECERKSIVALERRERGRKEIRKRISRERETVEGHARQG